MTAVELRTKERDPLPVVEMAEIEDTHGLVALHELPLYLLHTFKMHMTVYVIHRHRHVLDKFHNVIAEPMIEFALNGFKFLASFLGEGSCNALTHQTATVTHYITHQWVEHQVGNTVQYPPGQQRKQIPYGKHKIIKDSFHFSILILRMQN